MTPSVVFFFYIYMKKHSCTRQDCRCCFLPGMTCMKTVGTLWRNSMTGWSAMASSRKKTMVDMHAIRRAIRAPKMSPNLEKKNPTPNRSYWRLAPAIRRKRQYQQKNPNVLTVQTWGHPTAGSNPPWSVNNQTTGCRSPASWPHTAERHSRDTCI